MLDRFDRYSHALAKIVVLGMLPFAVGKCVAEPVGANPAGRAFVPTASSQQAVSPVPASIAFAGDSK